MKKDTSLPVPDGDSQIGTVGCVAVDNLGNLATATSTGGLVNKGCGSFHGVQRSFSQGWCSSCSGGACSERQCWLGVAVSATGELTMPFNTTGHVLSLRY